MNASRWLCVAEDPDARDPAVVGHKAAHLARLNALEGIAVPPWFVVRAVACRAHTSQPAVAAPLAAAMHALATDERAASAAEAARRAILAAPMPEDIAREIAGALAGLTRDEPFVAVRSSAIGEDSADASFAGQLDSFLFVHGAEAVCDAVRRCWASAFSDRAVVYRRIKGKPLAAPEVAVIVQRMVRADAAGVAFTADPVTGSREVLLVNATWGLGEGVVRGECATDTWRIARQTGAVTPDIRRKDRMCVFDDVSGSGVRWDEVPPERRAIPCLSDAQLQALREAALVIERAFGAPQDIEFAVEGKRLLVLQARPITTLASARRRGPPRIWDNSNIIESYAGVTTPLTFSFIRRAYATVYDQFLAIMGVPARTRRAHADLFEHLLGLLRGHVYYNLLNWYALLRFLPGYRHTREYMETMMGVRERLPPDALPPMPDSSWTRRWLFEAPRLLATGARLLFHLVTVNAQMRRFLREFDGHYRRWRALPLETMEPHELIRLYREMEERVLRRWKPPILSDFFAMIFYGLLRKLTAVWCDDATGGLANDLLCGDEQIESSAAPIELMNIARVIRADEAARRRFLSASPGELAAEWRHGGLLPPAARAAFDHYLDRFGDRCIGELKLETPKPREDPTYLFAVLRNYVTATEPPDPETMARRQRDTRAAAEQRVRAALGRRRTRIGVRRTTLFGWVLAQARRHIRNRENQRLARTRAFALVRRICRALGAHLERDGVLQSRDDVFWLSLDEVFGFYAGTALTARLRELVELRRAEFDSHRQAPPPPSRFTSFGPVYLDPTVSAAPPEAGPAPPARTTDLLRGTPCCGGVVRGRVRIIRAPTDDLKLDGDILVAEKTDPGWIPLYPSVSGLLIERGSVLSHSAIVAREMGKPAIVGIAGLCTVLQDGDLVEMDGGTGVVRRLAARSEGEVVGSGSQGSG